MQVMTTPAWRPMPDTSQFDREDPVQVREAAVIRSQYRHLMAIRWRSPEARAEDQQLGRLPENWHDWMDCPAFEGYQSLGCTCDEWVRQKSPKRYRSDKLQIQKSQKRPILVPEIVKTIDTAGVVPILMGHAQERANDSPNPELDLQATVVVSVADAEPLAQVVLPPHKSRSTRYPAWLGGKRSHLPQVRQPRGGAG